MLKLLLSCIAHYHEKVFVSESLGCRGGSSQGLQQTPHDPGGVALPWVHPACKDIQFSSLIGRQVAWPVMCVHTPLSTIQTAKVAQAYNKRIECAALYSKDMSLSRAANMQSHLQSNTAVTGEQLCLAPKNCSSINALTQEQADGSQCMHTGREH